MFKNLKQVLESGPISASAPCRMDMGGTVDLPAFQYALGHISPCTFNMAVGMRTHVTLSPHVSGRVKVSSKGFESADFALDEAPFKHPLGLMLALAVFFRGSGVHVHVRSESPPRSALGGSSVAAVAVAAAFCRAHRFLGLPPVSLQKIVSIAHAIESQTAGVMCGVQDQLAAAFGGVNAWQWLGFPNGPGYKRRSVVPKNRYAELSERLLLAYGGVPHDSVDVNGEWVRGFLSGETRPVWVQMARLTNEFTQALSQRRYAEAAGIMNREVDLRLTLTPRVLTPEMSRLVEAARQEGCGGRFTGAGAGGCVWAIGEKDAIDAARKKWRHILDAIPGAKLLPLTIEPEGVRVSAPGDDAARD